MCHGCRFGLIQDKGPSVYSVDVLALITVINTLGLWVLLCGLHRVMGTIGSTHRVMGAMGATRFT